MLILTRRKGESLMIGDDISVTVLGVRGTQVRIGVNAPRDIAVHRQEIYDRIRGEQGAEDGEQQKHEPLPGQVADDDEHGYDDEQA